MGVDKLGGGHFELFSELLAEVFTVVKADGKRNVGYGH